MPTHTPSERKKNLGVTTPLAGRPGGGLVGGLAGRRRRGLPKPKTSVPLRRGGFFKGAIANIGKRLRAKASASPLLKRRRRQRKTF